MQVLVVGATGMLGHALCQVLGADDRYTVVATARGGRSGLSGADEVVGGIDALNPDDLARAFSKTAPDAVINAVGLIKQLSAAGDPLQAIPINSLLPHRLSRLCELVGARLVHISTDCVFTGTRGLYKESDVPDAQDLYGVSKRLGEVVDAPHAVTLRTSIIGREQGSKNGLVEWFLNAGPAVQGYSRVVFSGLPTVVLAQLIADHVLPNAELHGLHHVSAAPIDKLSLLREVNRAYAAGVEITPNEGVVLDRSLDSERFRAATGWTPPSWPQLVERMRALQP